MVTGIVIVSVIALVGGIMYYKSSPYEEDVGVFVATIGGIVLAIVIIAMGIYAGYSRGKIKEFEMFKNTLPALRESMSEYERTTLVTKVVEYNEWLATIKYENTWLTWGLSIPDEVEKLEPIK